MPQEIAVSVSSDASGDAYGQYANIRTRTTRQMVYQGARLSQAEKDEVDRILAEAELQGHFLEIADVAAQVQARSTAAPQAQSRPASSAGLLERGVSDRTIQEAMEEPGSSSSAGASSSQTPFSLQSEVAVGGGAPVVASSSEVVALAKKISRRAIQRIRLDPTDMAPPHQRIKLGFPVEPLPAVSDNVSVPLLEVAIKRQVALAVKQEREAGVGVGWSGVDNGGSQDWWNEEKQVWNVQCSSAEPLPVSAGDWQGDNAVKQELEEADEPAALSEVAMRAPTHKRKGPAMLTPAVYDGGTLGRDRHMEPFTVQLVTAGWKNLWKLKHNLPRGEEPAPAWRRCPCAAEMEAQLKRLVCPEALQACQLMCCV